MNHFSSGFSAALKYLSKMISPIKKQFRCFQPTKMVLNYDQQQIFFHLTPYPRKWRFVCGSSNFFPQVTVDSNASSPATPTAAAAAALDLALATSAAPIRADVFH